MWRVCECVYTCAHELKAALQLGVKKSISSTPKEAVFWGCADIYRAACEPRKVQRNGINTPNPLIIFPHWAALNLPHSNWGRKVRTLPSCQIRSQLQFAFSTTHICSKPTQSQLISAKSPRHLMFTCVRQHTPFDSFRFSKKYNSLTVRIK